MTQPLLFAANWKMHLGPGEARSYAAAFRNHYAPREDRETWFFPPAVSVEAAAGAFDGFSRCAVGVQDLYWEPKGAFTGAISAGLARAAGARLALIGHSERRHRFGETEADTARKVAAVLAAGLIPVLCVGEKLEERERGETEAVVIRQLHAATEGISSADLSTLVVAYEPVWAIGTGRNAQPGDAAAVHRVLRARLSAKGAGGTRILYGGSVNQTNIAELLAQSEIDGVLVGGASLDPLVWAAICSTG